MSVAGILSSFLDSSSQRILGKKQQSPQEFQQLGKDLQAGNLAAAQSDFATLQQNTPGVLPSAAQNGNPLVHEFQQLSADLQSGNVPAAQQDYSTIQQGLQKGSAQLHAHHHHRIQGGGDGTPLSQLFDQLGQALQTGNLTSAQQAYTTLQQDFQQFSQIGGLQSPAPAQSGPGSLSVDV